MRAKCTNTTCCKWSVILCTMLGIYYSHLKRFVIATTSGGYTPKRQFQIVNLQITNRIACYDTSPSDAKAHMSLMKYPASINFIAPTFNVVTLSPYFEHLNFKHQWLRRVSKKSSQRPKLRHANPTCLTN